MTRWLWRRCPTRPHSELGRESLQRRWYFVLRHGRVGRCLVFQLHGPSTRRLTNFDNSSPGCLAAGCFFLLGAGWSSPVARQAHNLKVAGSNPAPATNTKENTHTAILLDGGFLFLGRRCGDSRLNYICQPGCARAVKASGGPLPCQPQRQTLPEGGSRRRDNARKA